ncbi:hypothetical protein BD780_000785 [Clostridium tetanomorphum]|uniref:Uncharacterized protein n=1 Tax=Clostridium tetanomorphum TaxID=1553 RepID=A0A923E6V2_CLOTT|nr:hypothetical protein [Clostridium tetanomorphum]KAJ52543.1 hypothetical protein CTM_07166 [Clostridium tetanomorphum DSM 665]MBC2396307.1 hypothetical protein [Clostridium tetanomorphum]MBP1863463.1 hypothetical protein [Clostridium tetanomorphum]NRS83560.1 hypothetical protein [Clostridium tetanomorphum]NRZ96760.1 hypothetical protein [Clostridium tetanomorphum]
MESDSRCEFLDQENINFVIIKNSQMSLTSEEYIEDAMKLCDGFDKYSNLNMNIIFIHNIIDDGESSEMQEKENEKNTTEEIELENNNVNILILKNIINIRRDNK